MSLLQELGHVFLGDFGVGVALIFGRVVPFHQWMVPSAIGPRCFHVHGALHQAAVGNDLQRLLGRVAAKSGEAFPSYWPLRSIASIAAPIAVGTTAWIFGFFWK